mgnify:CR=1 FL=1
MTMHALTNDSQSVEETRTCSFPDDSSAQEAYLERLPFLLVVMCQWDMTTKPIMFSPKETSGGELPLHRMLADELSIELLCLGFQLFRGAFDPLPGGFRFSLCPFHRTRHLIPLRLFR